jgi:hypothetical protein
MKKLMLMIVCSAVLLNGCATSASKTQNLTLGMTPKEVQAVLGSPTDLRAAQNFQVNRYRLRVDNNAISCITFALFTFGIGLMTCRETTEDFFVKYTDGKVSEFGKGLAFEPGYVR